MNLNTQRLIMLHDEAIKLGWAERYPHLCFSQEVARRADEMGNKNPSDDAIQIAIGMVDDLRSPLGKVIE